MEPIDLDAYLSRIGYAQARMATLECLRGIVLRHAQTIAFENLDPFMRQPVRLDPQALQQKLIHERRGGYCFEQNLLLWNALEQLGFDVSGLAARVMWNAPPPALPRTHMLLLVEIAGDSWIVDVGFGGLTLTGVLQLATDIEQSTPHESFRLLREGAQYVLQASVRGEWRALYCFNLQAQLPVDYEPVNWYLSTHPQSRFVNNLIAARSEPGRRYNLLNNEFTVHELHGETRRRTLTDASELRQSLTQTFLIPVPKSSQLDAALERVVRRAID
jgi:N-hydroxyarylamine O-acetyltransferase